MNTFGQKFRFTTFGESHGVALGCIVDGVPAGVKIDLDFIQSEMDRRKPGQNKLQTARKEDDKIEILSGTFEGFSTGTPIAMVLYNGNQKSRDYDNVKDLFRPGHADYTYFHKYGIRDYRGGGRSSARETSARVAAGAIAQLILQDLGIEVFSGICNIEGIKSEQFDWEYAKTSEMYALDKNQEEAQKKAILNAKNSHNSVGGVVALKATNVPKGLGEPIYYKLDSVLADAMMSINAVKAIDIGDGIDSVSLKGDENNDQIRDNGFKTNHSGGILGGISNGDDIEMKVYFKPTPSIFIEQETVNTENENVNYNLKGRHDPCVATRGSIVAQSMMSCVLVDMILLNMGAKMEHLRKVYK
ncbi:chorismate synthase [Arcobacter sp. 15-2]|uniref:chorismate synthase n=1 Tax=Arcobacter sp. 15-2 TaxID=3374109 RepID=UPI00399D25F7